MLSIRDIIDKINLEISEVLPAGSETYGVAYTTIKGPAVEEKPVSFDDTYPVQLYHKMNSLTSTKRINSGYGRNPDDTVNTYSNSIIVFNNKKQTKLNPDELAFLIQSAFPYKINSKYKSVFVTFGGVILNSQSVHAQEYISKDRLSETESLFQINYTLEITFNGCLDLCPEDFSNKQN